MCSFLDFVDAKSILLQLNFYNQVNRELRCFFNWTVSKFASKH